MKPSVRCVIVLLGLLAMSGCRVYNARLLRADGSVAKDASDGAEPVDADANQPPLDSTPVPVACSRLSQESACLAEGLRCRWYPCARRCYPADTSYKAVCGAASGECLKYATVRACDGFDTDGGPPLSNYCAWYSCVARCLPMGTPVVDNLACDCARRANELDCSGEPEHRCKWSPCGFCVPIGTPDDGLCIVFQM